MNIQKMKVNLLTQKIMANVSPEYARIYNLPEGYNNVGIFSVDNDDAAYLAVDDATKKANIKVIHAETFYGGSNCSWSTYGGGVYVMIAGPKITDVKSGLAYVKDYIENRTNLCNFDGEDGTAFYAECVPKIGKYYGELLGVPEGTSYAYLVGGPIETNYAMDKALKAGDTKVAKYWFPPSHANSSGAILVGTESACRSATRAFVDGLYYAVKNPLSVE